MATRLLAHSTATKRGAPRALSEEQEEALRGLAFGAERLTHKKLAELATATFKRNVSVATVRRTLKRTAARRHEPENDCFLSFKDDGATLRTILGLFNDSKRTLDISVFVISCPEITEAIIEAKKDRKVTVRVLTDCNASADRATWRSLQKAIMFTMDSAFVVVAFV